MNQDTNEALRDFAARESMDVTPSSKAVAREDRINPGLPPQGTPINQFEVRGYEMAKLMPDGSWKSLYHVNPSEPSRLRIITDAKWFNARGSGVYQARVLVSAEMPREADINPPLVLDADESQDIPQEVVEAMINEVELEAAERYDDTPEHGEPFAADERAEGPFASD